MIVPLGHDELDVRRMPVTLGLIVTNVLVFVFTVPAVTDSYGRLDGAARRLATAVLQADQLEGVRVSTDETNGLPPMVRASIERFATSGTTPCDERAEIEDIDALLAAEPVRGRAPSERTLHAREVDARCNAEWAVQTAAIDLASTLNGAPIYRWGYKPADPSIVTAFTSMFLHAGLAHLLGNLWYLFLAGAIVERSWGPLRYIAMYLTCGFYAVFAHHASAMGDAAPLVGASGAISALMGATIRTHPWVSVRFGYFWWFGRIFTGTFEAAVAFAIGLWFLLQIGSAVSGSSGGVAIWAHIGGFMLGLISADVGVRLGWIRTGSDDEADRVEENRALLHRSVAASRRPR